MIVVVFLVFAACSLQLCHSWNLDRFIPSKRQYRLKPTIYKMQSESATSGNVEVLKRIGDWACVKNCGACCKLGPLSSRPDLNEYLDEKNFALYKSMIGPDDWCKNFDQVNRICTIYDTRPDFCRVDKTNFKKMFGVEEDEFEDFCTFCCKENIADVYGEESIEMERFDDAQLDLIDQMTSIIIDPKQQPNIDLDSEEQDS